MADPWGHPLFSVPVTCYGVLLKAGPRPSGPLPGGPQPTARDGPAARRPSGLVARRPRGPVAQSFSSTVFLSSGKSTRMHRSALGLVVQNGRR